MNWISHCSCYAEVANELESAIDFKMVVDVPDVAFDGVRAEMEPFDDFLAEVAVEQ